MIKTCVYFRPGARDADLVRIGALYLSRTTGKKSIYVSFMPETDGFNTAINTAEKAMRCLLEGFSEYFLGTLHAVAFPSLGSEYDIVEAAFRLLPTNLKHDDVEDYPPEDFLVRAFQELEKQGLSPKTTVEADELIPA
jgi:hypothetical protein